MTLEEPRQRHHAHVVEARVARQPDDEERAQRLDGAQQIVSFAITPGFTDTAMAGDYLETRGGEGLLRDIPLGRVAEPEEIARIIEFCALDAPESMTGAVIDANGASYVR